MFRQYDWQCINCGVKMTLLVDVPAGEEPPDAAVWCELDEELKRCPYCGGVDGAERCRVNQVAEYLADKPFSPMVKGGAFDTEGKKPLPPMPEFTGQTGKDFQEFRNTQAFTDAKKERKARAVENKAKQQRAAAIRSGANIDVRHNPLPGDPNVMQ